MRTSKAALHGGGAAKVSSFYEEHWTVFTLIELVSGFAQSITLEPPGTAGHGFEFFVERSNGREWHQVKYQNAKLGKWTLAELRGERVLQYFKAKLAADPRASCLFVSAHAAHPLGGLCDRAAESASCNDFVMHFLSGELSAEFGKLHNNEWRITEQEAWEWLHRRIRVRTIDAASLEERISERARTFLVGEPTNTISALQAIARDNLYRPLSRATLIDMLAQRGMSPRNWREEDKSLESLVRATTRAFIDGVRQGFINAGFLARPEVESIVSRVVDPATSSAVILVTGGKGCGKSAVVASAASEVLARGIQVLTVDIAQLARETSSLGVGKSLGLPDRPPSVLAGLTGERRALLVVDSLDSLGVNRDKPIDLFTAIQEVIREVVAYPNVVLLLSCRSEDLDVDMRLRALTQAPEAAKVVNVGVLPADQTRAALVAAGHDPSQLSDEQLEIARKPANLRILTRITTDTIPPFTNEQELLDQFIEWAVSR